MNNKKEPLYTYHISIIRTVHELSNRVVCVFVFVICRHRRASDCTYACCLCTDTYIETSLMIYRWPHETPIEPYMADEMLPYSQ